MSDKKGIPLNVMRQRITRYLQKTNVKYLGGENIDTAKNVAKYFGGTVQAVGLESTYQPFHFAVRDEWAKDDLKDLAALMYFYKEADKPLQIGGVIEHPEISNALSLVLKDDEELLFLREFKDIKLLGYSCEVGFFENGKRIGLLFKGYRPDQREQDANACTECNFKVMSDRDIHSPKAKIQIVGKAHFLYPPCEKHETDTYYGYSIIINFRGKKSITSFFDPDFSYKGVIINYDNLIDHVEKEMAKVLA